MPAAAEARNVLKPVLNRSDEVYEDWISFTSCLSPSIRVVLKGTKIHVAAIVGCN